MKRLFFPLLLLSTLSLKANLSLVEEFHSAQQCLEALQESRKLFQKWIPATILYLDRKLWMMARGIEFVAENEALLARQFGSRQVATPDQMLVANATQSCWDYRMRFERQGRALIAFFICLIFSSVVLAIYLLFWIRPRGGKIRVGSKPPQGKSTTGKDSATASSDLK